MKEFLEEIVEVFAVTLGDLLCWIFFPKREVCFFQGAIEPFDEEARRLRVAWRYFD